MVMATVGSVFTKIFGSRNERLVKSYRKRVDIINSFEPAIRKKTDAELKARAQELGAKLRKGEAKDHEVLPEAFAIMRESMDRNIGLRNAFNPAMNFDRELLPTQQFKDLYTDIKFKCMASEHQWRFEEIPVQMYDALRDVVPADRPPYRARPFDVQLIGGMVLYEGKIAEMATGEGKTFVAPLACFMMGLADRHCHVVTVNDYLVRRDASWVAPAFYALGMTVGYIQAFMDQGTKKQMYRCTVTYGTNSEFGFDYLRDNMKTSVAEQVQGMLDYAIVDEVDSILIDEARTPLIISGPAHDDAPKYKAADEVVRKLIDAARPWKRANDVFEELKRRVKGLQGEIKNTKDPQKIQAFESQLALAEEQLPLAEEKMKAETQLYEVELDRKSAHLTHEGIQKAQEFAGVGSFYIGSNMDWPHLLEQSLRAHLVYERDREYVVERDLDGEIGVIIVDEFTGRKMQGRQWSDGLHQAVEAKEQLRIKPETQTMATVTLQNFFKLYKRRAGMTGTAMTEAEEFNNIYKLDVVRIPTNKPVVRKDYEDLIFMSEKAKWDAIVEQIKDCHEKGQPVLVGTTSVEKSERLSQMLMRRHGIEHEVLNAKNHEREADIVALAGQRYVDKKGQTVGRVTIATNMAGRGTDIKLAEQVPEAGGLFVLGTERHEARRIDNQLRGRSGRQGDPGESRFMLSLEDDLMKLFAGDFVLKALQRLGMKEDEAIEHSWVSKSVERAQKKVEERNFGIRKQLLEYDEVRDIQRNYFYKRRQQILEGLNLREMIFETIGESVEDAVSQYLDPDYVPTVIAEWVRVTFKCAVDAADVRETEITALEHTIKEHVRDEARSSITTSLDEFMDPDADPQDWDYSGLAGWSQDQFAVQVSSSQLKKMDREQIREALIEAALEQVERKDCAAVAQFLEKNYAQKKLAEWVDNKFDLNITAEELIGKAPLEAVEFILQEAKRSYSRREVEYPIEYALEATLGGGGTENIYASEQLANWLTGKYGVNVPGDQIRSVSVPQLHERLVQISQEANSRIEKEIDEAMMRLLPESAMLAAWVGKRFQISLSPDEFDGEPREDTKKRLYEWGHAFLRSELTELERAVLLQIYDSTWKDHLYAMDQLRETIGLHGYAQKDPRIEFKRSGSLLFQEFMKGIRDRVTDMIFKVRLQQTFVMKNVYTNPVESFQRANSYGVATSAAAQELRAEQAQQENTPPEETKIATIINESPKVGRNDPCPCGSGKKYKQCCGKNA
ncbi:MAG: SEC-C metal-binding domain-containing protein [Phycisphaerales bacterium]|nr:SEC-C metal-binding domain-containing protein [Phycisphaerales bacterium]